MSDSARGFWNQMERYGTSGTATGTSTGASGGRDAPDPYESVSLVDRIGLPRPGEAFVPTTVRRTPEQELSERVGHGLMRAQWQAGEAIMDRAAEELARLADTPAGRDMLENAPKMYAWFQARFGDQLGEWWNEYGGTITDGYQSWVRPFAEGPSTTLGAMVDIAAGEADRFEPSYERPISVALQDAGVHPLWAFGSEIPIPDAADLVGAGAASFAALIGPKLMQYLGRGAGAIDEATGGLIRLPDSRGGQQAYLAARNPLETATVFDEAGEVAALRGVGSLDSFENARRAGEQVADALGIDGLADELATELAELTGDFASSSDAFFVSQSMTDTILTRARAMGYVDDDLNDSLRRVLNEYGMTEVLELMDARAIDQRGALRSLLHHQMGYDAHTNRMLNEAGEIISSDGRPGAYGYAEGAVVRNPGDARRALATAAEESGFESREEMMGVLRDPGLTAMEPMLIAPDGIRSSQPDVARAVLADPSVFDDATEFERVTRAMDRMVSAPTSDPKHFDLPEYLDNLTRIDEWDAQVADYDAFALAQGRYWNQLDLMDPDDAATDLYPELARNMLSEDFLENPVDAVERFVLQNADFLAQPNHHLAVMVDQADGSVNLRVIVDSRNNDFAAELVASGVNERALLASTGMLAEGATPEAAAWNRYVEMVAPARDKAFDWDTYWQDNWDAPSTRLREWNRDRGY